jgi:hypothetical protein
MLSQSRTSNAWLPALILGLFCAVEWGSAQTIPATTADTESALHSMSRMAGVIFAGQVVAVRRHLGTIGATGIIEVEFAVEDAVRGVSGGGYTLREWAGLWPAGAEPFRVGQRFLMLLHAPGAAGLSSPVGGTDGAIPIRGSASLQDSQIASPWVQGTVAGASGASGETAQTDGRAVDLRWIATRVSRPISYRQMERPTGRSIAAHPFAVEESAAPVEGSAIEPEASVAAANADGVSANQGVAYTSVLSALRRWEKDDHATR